MSRYDVETAIHRLRELGIDTSTLHQDYYKIPLENIDLSKVERSAPTNSKVISKHTVIVDSRQRNYSIYPYPNNYLVELMEPHRNVERIELIAAMIPKTEYNINTENNLLIVNIGGSVVNGAIVGGTTKQLILTPGQYLIGSNVSGNVNYTANGSSTYLTGLIGELYNLLNTAFYTLVSPHFNVFLATVPSPNGTGQNASILNRIVITNDQDNYIIDFTNVNYTSGSPFRVMGFNKQIYSSSTNVIIFGDPLVDDGTCSPVDLQTGTTRTISINALTGIYDYNLKDDPKYIIMQLEFGNKSADRIESSDIATNQKFAIIIYDSNDPDNVQTYNTTTSSTDPVQLSISRQPGNLKALKGADFDKKILVFEPPITLENFKISFYKYDNSYYDFHNREHLLTFDLDVADYDPKYRY